MLFLLRSCVPGISCEPYYTTCTKNATAICEYQRKNAAKRPEGRDITRHLLFPQSAAPTAPSQRGACSAAAPLGRTESSAPTSRHSEPVRRLAWESVLPKRETDCRVAARREASALGVLLAMTARRCRADGTSRPPSPTKQGKGCGQNGRAESSAPTRFVRDVEDAVPYGMVGGVCQGRTPYDAKCPGASRGRDAYSVIRPLFPAAPSSPPRRTGRSHTPSSTDPCGTRRRQRG